MATYVTATEWDVSKSRRSCLFSGPHDHGPECARTTLSVYRSLDLPNKWGGRGVSVRHPVHDGRVFATKEHANAYAVEVGLLREYGTQEGDKA